MIMKKRFMAILAACVMALSFAVPVAASDFSAVKPINVETQNSEAMPFTEFTRTYFKNTGDAIYWRVWGITSGRWLTEWTRLNLL